MKKKTLEDHLGAVLERSWLVLGAVLGACWGVLYGKTYYFVKINVFEKKHVVLRGDLERSWVDLGAQEAPKWAPQRVKKGVKLSEVEWSEAK